jgi:hypothetical protein
MQVSYVPSLDARSVGTLAQNESVRGEERSVQSSRTRLRLRCKEFCLDHELALKTLATVALIGALAALIFAAPVVGGAVMVVGLIFASVVIAKKINALERLAKQPNNSVQPNPGITQENLRQIREKVCQHFAKPYEDRSWWKEVTRAVNGTPYTVNRPNHGLMHSLRQALLAGNIVTLLNRQDSTGESGIIGWVKKKMRDDPHFVTKVCWAAAFQRSGRQSEISSADDKETYKLYERRDVTNFKEGVPTGLFSDDELETYGKAILWSNEVKHDEDSKYIAKILHAAHTLDLRRILSFDGERIQDEAIKELFRSDERVPDNAEEIKSTLWAISGEYLNRTGERDLVTQRDFQDRFFTIHSEQNPQLI